MVGTAQADNFSVFIKKVGYSVGVEALLERARDFGEKYASVPSLRYSDWTWLVRDKWKLKTENVADVFAALGITRVRNREVFPGPIGESLGIVRRLTSDSEFEQASRLLVAIAIVDADGDIFLNALRSGFDKERTAEALVTMVREKRDVLFRVFQSARDQEAVARFISIDRQRTNRGSKSGGGLTAISRGAPLNERALGLGLPQSLDVNAIEVPSSDYLHKISVSRRGWAESLDLFDGSGLTDSGLVFLSTLSQQGLSCKDGTYCVWPTAFEAQSNQFDIRGSKPLELLTTWKFQSTVFSALGGNLSQLPHTSSQAEDIAKLVHCIYRSYRDLSQSKSIIRNEIAYSVVTASLLSLFYANGSSAVNVEKLLTSSFADEQGIVVRPSRTIEYAITVRGHAS